MTELASGTRKAAKRYRCEWCPEMVEVGELHEFWVWVDLGRAETVRAHVECIAPLRDSASLGYEGEYCGEGHPRGEPCGDH